MNWLKKWYYLILFVGAGAVYLTYVNGWQIYKQQAAAVKGWYDEVLAFGYQYMASGQGQLSGSGIGSGGDQTSGSGIGSGGNQTFGSGTEDGAADVLPAADENGNIQQMGGEAAGENETPQGDASGEPGGNPPDAVEPDEPASREVSYMTVEDDYFADAVFIGDSRTVGMSEYGSLEDVSTFYASTGLTVYKLFTAEIVPVQGQKKKITVEKALQQNTFSKIYFMMGINEMGVGTVDTFMEKYEEAVKRIQELQPDAVIYLQGIMKVTAERSGMGDYITNEGIEERNERIAQLADNKNLFYLDVNPAVCDETGGMIASYTFDGVHLKGKYIVIWKDFLKEHAVRRDD